MINRHVFTFEHIFFVLINSNNQTRHNLYCKIYTTRANIFRKLIVSFCTFYVPCFKITLIICKVSLQVFLINSQNSLCYNNTLKKTVTDGKLVLHHVHNINGLELKTSVSGKCTLFAIVLFFCTLYMFSLWSIIVSTSRSLSLLSQTGFFFSSNMCWLVGSATMYIRILNVIWDKMLDIVIACAAPNWYSTLCPQMEFLPHK